VENKQQIGNITDSILREVNVNKQIEGILNLVQTQNNYFYTQINNLSVRVKQIEDAQKEHSSFDDRIKELEEKIANEISDLRKEIDTPKAEKTPYMGILVAIFGLAFLFFLFAILLNKSFGFGISGDSIVLTFVGIAATFVVVSNYAQVKEIEDRTKDLLEQERNKLKENITLINNKITIVENGFNSTNRKIEKQRNEITKFYDWKNSFFDEEIKLIKEKLKSKI
jgi:peptidoglycan hydrolase CwlO-like protein